MAEAIATSVPKEGAKGPAAGFSLGLLLADHFSRSYFEQFCRGTNAATSLKCWEAIEKYKVAGSSKKRQKIFSEMTSLFLVSSEVLDPSLLPPWHVALATINQAVQTRLKSGASNSAAVKQVFVPSLLDDLSAQIVQHLQDFYLLPFTESKFYEAACFGKPTGKEERVTAHTSLAPASSHYGTIGRSARKARKGLGSSQDLSLSSALVASSLASVEVPSEALHVEHSRSRRLSIFGLTRKRDPSDSHEHSSSSSSSSSTPSTPSSTPSSPSLSPPFSSSSSSSPSSPSRNLEGASEASNKSVSNGMNGNGTGAQTLSPPKVTRIPSREDRLTEHKRAEEFVREEINRIRKQQQQDRLHPDSSSSSSSSSNGESGESPGVDENDPFSHPDQLPALRAEVAIKLWIEKCLSSPVSPFLLEKDFVPQLKSGVILCQLINRITTRNVFFHPLPDTPVKQRENVIGFLEVCSEMGLKKSQLFGISDLGDEQQTQRTIQRVINTLGHLASHINSKGDINPEIAFVPLNEIDDETFKANVFFSAARVHEMKTLSKIKSGPLRKQAATLSVKTSTDTHYINMMNNLHLALTLQSFIRMANSISRLKKLRKSEVARQNVATEILVTERGYKKNLETLKTVYLMPLLQKFPKYLDFAINPLLGEVTVIISYSDLLLSELVGRIEQWSPRQALGDLFLQLSDYLKMYTQYVNSYGQARTLLTDLSKSHSDIADFLNEAQGHPETRGQSVFSFMIMPVQRLPRYQMLLEQLLKRSAAPHPDNPNLTRALEKITSVTSYVDKFKRDFEKITKVIELQKMFVGKFDNIAEPHRRFVKRGKFFQVSDKAERELFLFNDLLVITKPRVFRKNESFKVRAVLPLDDFVLIDRQSPDDDKGVLDFVEKPKGDKKTSKSLLMAYTEDPSQKTAWKTKIRRLQLKLQAGKATIMSQDDSHSSSSLSSTDAVLLKVIKQEQESKQKTQSGSRRVISIEEARSRIPHAPPPPPSD